jgi:hypothetical protein
VVAERGSKQEIGSRVCLYFDDHTNSETGYVILVVALGFLLTK